LVEHKCNCGSKKFYLCRETRLLVDFGMEGAIEGHPALMGKHEIFRGFVCASCGESVSPKLAHEMRQEVL